MQKTETIPYEKFITRAIVKLRDPEKGKGIHTIYSGLFAAFKDYYGEDKNRFKEIIEKLTEEGKIEKRYAKGGVVIYLPGECPTKADSKAALAKIME
jgi:hypothetical protein